MCAYAESHAGMKSVVVAIAFSLASAALSADRVWLDETDVSRMKAGWGEPRPCKSVDGNEIKIGVVAFKRGVGTLAPSSYKIPLGGNALSFEATVGADDEAGEKASVAFRVVADGKVVAAAAPKRGEAVHIKADLAGARVAVLEVDALGENWDDHADWADAFFTFKCGTRPLSLASLTRQFGILTPAPAKTPRINGARRHGVRPGRPILYKVAVTGEKPVKISVEGLPDGVVYNADNRTITGSVAKTGEYELLVVAENAFGKAERKMSLVVGDALCLTPPMGWNSWNAFAGGVSQEKMVAATDMIVKLGLDEHGYSFVNIDDFWQRNPQNGKDDPTLAGPERNEDGSIAPNARFPDMKALADYIHSKGLKAGLYSSPGPYTCGGCTGSWLHELQDARSWAEWGYDYVKYDWCSYGSVATGEGHDKFRRPYFLMGRFLAMQPRDIVFSLCQYGNENVPVWGEQSGGQLWRTTGDVFDTWASVYGSIRSQAAHWMHSKPGAWNDADMLVVGKNTWAKGDSRLSPNEQYTHISMWSMFSCPLMIGCDLTLMDDFTLNLLTNDEVIEIDQDPLGLAAALVCEDGKGREIWARPLDGGAMAFALLNAGDEEQTIEVDLAALGIKGKWKVRDCWRQKDEGVFEGKYAMSVPGHATHLIRLVPDAGAGHLPCLVDVRDNSWCRAFEADRKGLRRSAPGRNCGGCE